jgi:hypothetical protein
LEDAVPNGGALRLVRTGPIFSIATLGVEVISGIFGIAETICGDGALAGI